MELYRTLFRTFCLKMKVSMTRMKGQMKSKSTYSNMTAHRHRQFVDCDSLHSRGVVPLCRAFLEIRIDGLFGSLSSFVVVRQTEQH